MTGSRSSKSSSRWRTALTLASPVAVVTLAIIVVSLVALARLGALAGTSADAGLARVGSDLALVIVTEKGPDISATRSLVFGWGIVVPVVALLTGAVVAWRISGRFHTEIETARASIENADEDRQNRLQEVVHELRTPLAVMGTNLELAGYEAGPEGVTYIEAASRAVGRMSRTVDDLAGHGRLAVETQPGPVDLAELARSAVGENAGPARSRGVAVEAVGTEKVPVDGVDPAAIRTALGNFLSNALRLAPRGSVVSIDWGAVDDWAWVAVADEGPGLAPSHHARAFERGWQGSHDRDRRTGFGLGLTIARQLTEAQGGLVTIESEEGGGAVLALWLPLSAGADPNAVVASDRIHPLCRPWARTPSAV